MAGNVNAEPGGNGGGGEEGVLPVPPLGNVPSSNAPDDDDSESCCCCCLCLSLSLSFLIKSPAVDGLEPDPEPVDSDGDCTVPLSFVGEFGDDVGLGLEEERLSGVISGGVVVVVVVLLVPPPRNRRTPFILSSPGVRSLQ